jgi:PAS domain-containing protein
MWAVDAESFRFVMVNDDAAQMYGYTKTALLLLTFLDILAPEERERFKASFRALRKSGDAGDWTCSWPNRHAYRLRFRFYHSVIEGNTVLMGWAIRIFDHPVVTLAPPLFAVCQPSQCSALD